MEVKEIIKKIYIAEDGKEFLSEEKCLEYEDEILCIRYYLIISHPSIRNYQDIFVLAAVYNRNRDSSSHYSIAFKWAMDKFGLLQKIILTKIVIITNLSLGQLQKKNMINVKIIRF